MLFRKHYGGIVSQPDNIEVDSQRQQVKFLVDLRGKCLHRKIVQRMIVAQIIACTDFYVIGFCVINKAMGIK